MNAFLNSQVLVHVDIQGPPGVYREYTGSIPGVYREYTGSIPGVNDEFFQRIFSTNFFDEFFLRNLNFFDEFFLQNFRNFFNKFFYLLTIESFRIGVPSILLFSDIMPNFCRLHFHTTLQIFTEY